MHITHTPETFAVDQVEKHLLTFWRETMHFIQEKDTTISLLNQSFAVTISPSIRATHDPKKMRHQQLWVARVVRTIEADKRCISRKRVLLDGKGMHQTRKSRFANATGSTEQRMQTTRRIQHSRFRLLNSDFQ